MSVAIIGVAGTVAGAGATLYATNQQSKAAKKAAGAVNVGGKPKAANYDSVDIDKEQLDAILANLNSLYANKNLVDSSGAVLSQADLARASRLIPNYRQMMQQQATNAGSLLEGKLPYDDVLQIAADRGSLSGALGTPGTAGPATLRDLGLSRLDAIKTGSGLMKGMVDIAETISPVSRYLTPASSMISPTDRIRTAIEQNQLIQQSEQSANNLAAGVSPTDQARSMIDVNSAMHPASASYADAAVSALGSLAGAYSQYKAGSSKPGTGPDGMSAAMFTRNSMYRPNSIVA
jgi:hypothetical protein